MAFASRVSYTGSTSTGPYSFSSISLFDDSIVPLQSQLVVTITGATQVYTASAPAAGEYSMDKTLKTITFGSAPASADIVKIARSTASTAYVDFTNNSPLTAADLDIATQQSLFLAEEGVEAIEAGDAVLALPELTDTDSTMAPGNGDFLRWSDSDSEWQAQSFTPDGTGPEVNIVTEFPTSPAAGDLIFHSRYGATYIYEGSSWQIMCGTGSVAAPASGTTVSELTFGTEGRMDGLTLTSGWTALTPSASSPAAGGSTDPGLYGGTSNFLANPTSDGSNWTSVGGITTPVHDFSKCWFASGLSVGASGELTFDNATYAAEASGDDVADNFWWGGSSETGAGLDATAVLLPRVDRSAMDSDTGFTSGSVNMYQNILWYYPAGINWDSQSWRVTAKFVTLAPDWAGTNTDKFAGMSFVPANFYAFDKQAGDITMSRANDANGIIAKGVSATDAATVAPVPPIFGVAATNTGTGGSSTGIVPNPHIHTVKTDNLSIGDFFTLSSDRQGFAPVGVTSISGPGMATEAGELTSTTTTQQSMNGLAMTDKAITWSHVIEWDADAKVVTVSTTPDSNSNFTNSTRGANAGMILTSDPATGDHLKQVLSGMDTGFFYNHGANGSYLSAASGSRPDGLVSIKIETL
ncbi:MAG: hypothetical protein GY872_04970 [Roseibacillus sp.]|nr:hypothetical protein [Roseibacillus sp.]